MSIHTRSDNLLARPDKMLSSPYHSNGSCDGDVISIRDCVQKGLVAIDDIEEAASRYLNDAAPLRVTPEIFVVLPKFAGLPANIRASIIEIILSGHV